MRKGKKMVITIVGLVLIIVICLLILINRQDKVQYGSVSYMGDVNNDGTINAQDYILVRKQILGLTSFSSTQKMKADMNSDGNITAQDYILIRKTILGLIPQRLYNNPTTTPTTTPRPISLTNISSALSNSINKNVNFNSSGNTLLFGSDYQSSKRASHFNNVISKVSKTPSLTLFVGDYTDGDSDIVEISKVVHQFFPNSGVLFTQGNHDDLTSYITKTGGYEADNYVIYVINYDNNNKSKSSSTLSPKCGIHSNAASNLDNYLQKLVSSNIRKPVFVLSHLPLHSSSRGDNLCSSYFAEVLNKYGNKLDIIYLFGHNHSSTYDDCLGGSINYVNRGSTLDIACHSGNDKPSSVSCSSKKYSTKINFTYLNAGYVGFSSNTDGYVTCSNGQVKSTDALTMSYFKINSDNIEYTRFSKNGVVSSKNITRIN